MLRATSLYYLLIHNKDNVLEAKKILRETAEICSRHLSKEEKGNIYAANLVAALLI